MQQIDMSCWPVLTFYVQFGTFSPGTVIDFTMCSARAAVCDFTKGDTTANVTFLPDGNWDVQMS